MKKELIITCLIVIVIVILDIVTQKYTKTRLTEVGEILNSVCKDLYMENEDSAKERNREGGRKVE